MKLIRTLRVLRSMSNNLPSNSFQNLENEIVGLASLYFKAVDLNKQKDNQRHLPFIETIRKTYQQLSIEERKVIDNEFFYKKYPLWWKANYSQISYKKLKHKSMAHFLEVFYDTAI